MKILQNAYAKLNSTKKGREISTKLEKSPDVYQIKPINKDAYYCASGSGPQCNGNPRTVFIDPNNNIELPTNNGMMEAPKAVVLGHELGHAIGDKDDGPNAMNNVIKNENPIRQELGIPDRNSYYVPKIQWVKGTK